MNIEIYNLSKSYKTTRALQEVSFQIPGGVFGLLGPNGAGKTTLMRILATLLLPSAGKVRVGDWDVTRQPNEVRRHLGYLPQEFGFFGNLTAFEMLDYIAAMKGVPRNQRKTAIESALVSVGLEDRARQNIRTYSGGMKQRLGIAQALLGDPSLLIVDEPTAGLDPEERIRFRGIMGQLGSQHTVLLSTHIVADIEASCDRVAVLQRGRVVFNGTPAGLAAIAQGRVWDVELDQAEWTALQSRYHLISSRPQNGHVHLRLVGTENPLGRGTPRSPGVEDGYVALISNDNQFVEVEHA
ncbi:MAG TPA: ABC transporter ATP-binding protein [Anaerolineaceae bacterium]|nr:ABC transporter ATP-binding protein [Anaerolineaceae bacterium]